MSTDIKLALKYLAKARNAEDRGIEFDISITTFKNLMRAKRCKYTGIEMTMATSGTQKPTDKTIDRIDSTKGYVVGNVVACCHAANQVKSFWERGGNPLTPKHIIKMIAMIEKVS